MAGFFDRMLGRNKEPGSASRARERLQVVLVHDRINLPPERLQMMKDELVAVISKYVALTDSDVEIALEQRNRNQNWLRAEVAFAKPIDPSDPDEDAPYPNTSALALDIYMTEPYLADPEPMRTYLAEDRPDTDIFITSGVSEIDEDSPIALPRFVDASHSDETRPTRNPADDEESPLQSDSSIEEE